MKNLQINIAIFWDNWFPNGNTYTTFPVLPTLLNCNVNLLMENWMLLDKWNLPETMAQLLKDCISALPINFDSTKQIIWENNDNGNFKGFYSDFFENDETCDWYKPVWHSKHSKRYSSCTWKALRGGLKTVDVLLKRKIMIHDISCPLCHYGSESVNHLLFECDYTFKVLTKVLPSLHSFLLRPTIIQALQYLDTLHVDKVQKNVLLLRFNAAVYFIWQERNNRKFNRKAVCDITLSKKITRAVYVKVQRWKRGDVIIEQLNLSY